MSENNSPLDLYEIKEKIGEGGGGTVYKAFHKRLLKDVVIKKTHDYVGSRERRTEVDVLKNLHHSYIPTVYDYFVIDGVSYTVMDYIEGESFKRLLDKGIKFKESQVIKYGKQLCEAVEYLHSREIPVIHGDIKPDNIMLKSDDNICLIDFNISGISEGNNAFTTGCTRGYSAPEIVKAFNDIIESLKREKEDTGDSDKENLSVAQRQIEDDETDITPVRDIDSDETEVVSGIIKKSEFVEKTPNDKDVFEEINKQEKQSLKIPIDKRSDVYSIGATLFHLYTGVRLDKMDDKLLESSTSDGYIYILNKALQENPSKRFSSAGEMLNAFNNIHQKEKVYQRTMFAQNMVRITLTVCFLIGLGLIFYGVQLRRGEKEELYQFYINQMEEIDSKGSELEFESAFKKAIELKPDTAEAYIQKALFLFNRGQYQETIDFIEYTLQYVSLDQDAELSTLYYIMGNAHYAIEEYQDAVNCFRNALKYDSQNADIYGDYAISSAKLGDLDTAIEVSKKAEEYGISDDHLLLIRGEIEFAKNNYDSSEEYLREYIKITSDEYRKMCAYITCGKAITADGTKENYDKCIEFLSKGVSDVSIEYSGYILGLLSEMYIQAYGLTDEDTYCEGAIQCLDELIENGWASYNTYNNVIILCTNSERYREAEEYIGKMETRYPENYNVFKRKAFLELELQNKKNEDERDYLSFAEYYRRASELYVEQAGEMRDPEMELLQDDLQILIDSNWLEGE